MTLGRTSRPVGLSTAGRAQARARRELARAALRSERRGWGPEEKRTVALGVVATAATAAVVAGEIGRIWRRGSAPLPNETDDILTAAQEAVAETVEAASAGYRDVPPWENAMFNLLSSFVVTFATTRGIAYVLRSRRSFGPFRNLVIGRRHIHHFVPGITIAFIAGAISILNRNPEIEPKLALAFGTGMGLTLDESALLLELEDVYWSPEGLLGVQITLAVIAMIAALALALRFLRRGEEIVLETAPAPASAGLPDRAAGSAQDRPPADAAGR